VSERQGKSIVYELQFPVLEDAILSFVRVFGWTLRNHKRGNRIGRRLQP